MIEIGTDVANTSNEDRFRVGPCIELFARRRRAGWTSLGDQVPVTDTPRALDSGGPQLWEAR